MFSRLFRLGLFSRPFCMPSDFGQTLWFEEIHSGCECNPVGCDWTPKISLRNSQSLSETTPVTFEHC